jgi:hypothetical protein
VVFAFAEHAVDAATADVLVGIEQVLRDATRGACVIVVMTRRPLSPRSSSSPSPGRLRRVSVATSQTQMRKGWTSRTSV